MAAPQNEDELKAAVTSSMADPFKDAREWEDDEKEEYLNNLRDEPCPLWMDEEELAEARKNGNKQLEAITQMVYDQEPDDLAEQFKNQGNSYYKRGKSCYAGAKKAYLDAVVQCRKALKDDDMPPERLAELNALLVQILANLSLVNLKLENFRTVIMDCQEASALEPTNAKIYFRAAKAAQGLKRYKRALQILDQGISCVPGGHASLQKLKLKIQPLRQAELDAQKLKKAAAKAAKKKASALRKALKKRKVQLVPLLFECMAQYEGAPSLDDAGAVNWPLLFLYEEHNQSDFVRIASENNLVYDHLAQMFPSQKQAMPPAPWDCDRAYTLERLVVLVRSHCGSCQDEPQDKQHWLRVSSSSTLGQVLSHSDCEVPGFPVFWVLAEGTPFAQSFMAKYKGRIEAVG